MGTNAPVLSATATIAIPCVKLPDIPKVPKLELFGMAEFKGISDISAGLPNNCSMNINLLVQLMPFLAGLTCFMRVLKVMQSLGEFAKAVPNPVKMGEKVGDLISSIDELAECFGIIIPLTILKTIKQILLLIIGLIQCLLDQIQSLLNISLKIDLNAAADNPELAKALNCAQDNVNTAMESLMSAMEMLSPIFAILNDLGAIAGQSFSFPAVSGGGGAAVADFVNTMEAVVGTLQEIADALPA
jgi:hypothetical protein